MRRKRASEDFKRFVLVANRLEQKQESRKRRLYNKLFKKSLFYWSSLIVRLFYVLFCLTVFLFYNKSKGFQREKFISYKVEYDGEGKYSRITNYLVTNKQTYYVSIDFKNYNSIKSGDEIEVEYNVFNKPIYFKKENWNIKYGIYKNYTYYAFLLFATSITFFFNDGYESFTIKLLYVFYTLNIISIVLFFIT